MLGNGLMSLLPPLVAEALATTPALLLGLLVLTSLKTIPARWFMTFFCNCIFQTRKPIPTKRVTIIRDKRTTPRVPRGELGSIVRQQ